MAVFLLEDVESNLPAAYSLAPSESPLWNIFFCFEYYSKTTEPSEW